MQASSSKRLAMNLLRGQLRALDLPLMAATQSIVEVGVLNSSLINKPARSFSESNVQFDKITSYESLISRISNASNINDLLNVMNQNILLYKNEHIVLTLRVLARIIKNANQSDIESLANDERYTKLVEKAQENIEQYNEYEILDFLFWLRRFRMSRIQTHVTEESIEKLSNKVKDFVKSKSFNFRNLVNLFYDLSFLNRGTNEIAAEILNELKTDSKLLTPFTVVQILQACARRGNISSSKQFALADFVTKSLPNLIQEFDSDQKCLVFKYLASMEMHLNPPKYRTPIVLYTLRNQLKESLDNLSEVGVINILEAYENLTGEFPVDLLEEIKDMVILTIQHNSSNIKSFFLLDFLERMSRLRRNRRLNDDKIVTVYEEIAKRVLNDEFMGKFRNIERLVEIYQKCGIKYEPLVQKIHARLSEVNYPFFSAPIFQCLIDHGLDVSGLLDKFLTTDFAKNMGSHMQMRLYIVLSSIQGNKYESTINDLKSKLLAKPEELPKLLGVLAESGVSNQYTNDILTQAIQQLKEKKEGQNTISFFRNMFASCTSKTARNEWLEYAKQNFAELPTNHIQRFCDAFFNIEDLNVEQVLLFTSVLTSVVKPENIPFRRITFALKDNKDFILELARIEGRLKSFLTQYLSWMDVHKKEVRLADTYSLIKRLESCGVRLNVVKSIARKGYEIARHSEVKQNPQIETIYAVYLMENNLLRVDDARDFYEKHKSNINDVILSSKFFTYILKRSSPEYLQKEEVKNEAQEKLELLHKFLSETNARTVLNALATILAFPPQLLQPNRDLYVKSIREYIGFGNQTLYSGLIAALPADQVKSNYEFYVPFMRELINNYGNYNKRMSSTEIVKALKKFSDCNTRNPSIYNYILTDIGRIFNSIKVEEHVELITAFSKMSIKQTDLFDKILTKINNNPQGFAGYLKPILLAFFRVGYDSQTAKTIIPELLEKLNPQKASNLFPFALYLPILNLSNEAELFEKIIPNLKGPAEVPQRNATLLYEYLRRAYKNKPEYAEAVKSLINDINTTLEIVHKESNALNRSKGVIGDYLKAMKVEYQDNFSADGHKVDLYIPEKKTIVKIFLSGEVNFDRFSLTGSALLRKRTYENIEGYKPVFINMAEFNSIPEHMNKINYLIAVGIENQNTTGMYDFSHIDKTAPAEESEEADQSKAELEAEGEEEDAVEEDKKSEKH